MTTLTASKARASLYRLIDKASTTHDPIQISGKRSSAVLIGSEDWGAIQETLYLVSIPGMRKSLLKGAKTPPARCSQKDPW